MVLLTILATPTNQVKVYPARYRVDFVIVTGGLGTTDDDLTNEAVSVALNRPTMPNLLLNPQWRKPLAGVLSNPGSGNCRWLIFIFMILSQKGRLGM